jgi:hypothetical protein
MPVAAIGAVASLAGSAMAAGAAEDAADTQAASADRATASQEKMFNKQVELQRPWRDTGGLGLNRLAYELGLSRTPMYSASGPVETEQQIRQRLQSQYMRPGQGAPQQAPAAAVDPNVWSMERLLQEQGQAPRPGAATWMNGNDETGINGFGPQTPGAPATYDEAGLNAAVQAEFQRQQAGLAGQTQDHQGAEFGGLLRNFGKQDLYDDPSYQFRMDEGLKSRNFLSGAALKGIERYGQDYASTEYGKSFDRYNINNTNKFNRLASISGIGQTAANQTGAAAANFGAQAGSNMIGAGNAQAAGRVGASNAWTSGIGSAIGGFQQNALMNSLQQPVSYRYPVPTYEGAEY